MIKKTESDKNISVFILLLFSYILYILDLVWNICIKQNIIHLGIDKYIIATFPLQRYLAFSKDLFFVIVLFILVAIGISVSLLGNR